MTCNIEKNNPLQSSHFGIVCLLVVAACDGSASSEDDEPSASQTSERETSDDGKGGETSTEGETAGDEDDSGSNEEHSEDAVDPELDTDEDGLPDVQEEENGTDPTKVDTDGDGYWDSWEIKEGSDPLDPEDRIYIGNWPYNPNKDNLESTTIETAQPQTGTYLARMVFEDQYGDMVDIYDFSETGKPVIVDISAVLVPTVSSIVILPLWSRRPE